MKTATDVAGSTGWCLRSRLLGARSEREWRRATAGKQRLGVALAIALVCLAYAGVARAEDGRSPRQPARHPQHPRNRPPKAGQRSPTAPAEEPAGERPPHPPEPPAEDPPAKPHRTHGTTRRRTRRRAPTAPAEPPAETRRRAPAGPRNHPPEEPAAKPPPAPTEPPSRPPASEAPQGHEGDSIVVINSAVPAPSIVEVFSVPFPDSPAPAVIGGERLAPRSDPGRGKRASPSVPDPQRLPSGPQAPMPAGARPRAAPEAVSPVVSSPCSWGFSF